MGTFLNVILVVKKTYQYFISLKLIQNYSLFLPFHNETQNNSNIGKKKQQQTKWHICKKENKTVQETKTERYIKFPQQKLKNQYLKSF